MHNGGPVPPNREEMDELQLLFPSSLSSSPSSSCSTTLTESNESLDWYVDGAASPESPSPITFMSDTNLSGPSSPAPLAATQDASVGEWAAYGAVPALVPLTEMPFVKGDEEQESRALRAGDASVRAGASVLSFNSSFFSSSTTTLASSSSSVSSVGTPASPTVASRSSLPNSNAGGEVSGGEAQPVSPVLNVESQPHVQSPLLSPAATSSSAVRAAGAPAVADDGRAQRGVSVKASVPDTSSPARDLEVTHTMVDKEERKWVDPLGSPPDSLQAASPPPTQTPEGEGQALVALPATRRGTVQGGFSLSHLAAGLLIDEEPSDSFLPLTFSRINMTELSWVPRPLPDPKPKAKRRKARQPTHTPTTSSETTSTDTSECARVAASSTGNGNISGYSAKRKRVREETQEMEEKATSPAAISTAFDEETTRNESTCAALAAPAPPPMLKSSPPSPQQQDGLDDLLALLYLPVPQRVAQPSQGNEEDKETSAASFVDDGFGEFSMENWALPTHYSAMPRDGRENVLSQLSFLVSADADESVGAITPPKSKRKPKRLRRDSAVNAPGTYPGAVSEGSISLLDSLDGDAPLIALQWSRRDEAALNASSPQVSKALPSTEKKTRKRHRHGKKDNHDATAAAAEGPTDAAQTSVLGSLAWWEATRAAASSLFSEEGRPCLWIEVADDFQETHAAVLRQLLVYWGCIHREKHTKDAAPLSPTTPTAQRKRYCESEERSAAFSQAATRCDDGFGRECDGIVVLLCPPTVSLAAELRWWVRRAHAAHGFVPPLFAISISAGDTTTASCSSSAASSFTAADLMAQAVLHASRDMRLDPCQSLAVTCSAGGSAALAQVLPASQLYDSLESCAEMLGGILRFPSPAQLLHSAGNSASAEGVDFGSLAAVTATTTCSTALPADAAEREAVLRQSGTSLQDRCFKELCTWNGLAAHLRDRPRRPQMLLHRAQVGAVLGPSPTLPGEVVSTEREAAAQGIVSPAAKPRNSTQSLWISYGLVRPATCNDDTFADTARRDARLLASHPPPVTLLPVHMSALSLFASVVFTRSNFVTAVNVVEAHTRSDPQHAAQYISGYSCVVTGPMRYTVAATVRRYLHVHLSIDAAPLLALVSTMSELGGAKPLVATPPTAHVAAESEDTFAPSAVAVAVGVGHLARTQWRHVLRSLSCTCTPGAYEQVVRANDGAKVCRHLAELFFFFTTKQFCVVGGGGRRE